MNRVPQIWQVFGPTGLVLATLGSVTLFNTLTADLAELRRDMVRLQEQRIGLATAAEVRGLADERGGCVPEAEMTEEPAEQPNTSPTTPALVAFGPG